jgi:hypothetical protein
MAKKGSKRGTKERRLGGFAWQRGAVSPSAARDAHTIRRARPGSIALRIPIAHCKLQSDLNRKFLREPTCGHEG